MTGNDGDEAPDWLDIELVDNKLNDEFGHVVTAQVVAEQLPVGLNYREAVVRFGFPGAYLDYTFKQGRNTGVDEQFESKDAVAVGYYDIMGHKLQGMQQGLNIVKMSDGSVRKLFQQ